MKNNVDNYVPVRVTPAMRCAASRWNHYASRYAKWLKRALSHTGQITKEDMQFCKNTYKNNPSIKEILSNGNGMQNL